MQSPVPNAWLWDEQKSLNPCCSAGASSLEKPDTEYKTRSDEWSGKVPGAMKIYSKHI